MISYVNFTMGTAFTSQIVVSRGASEQVMVRVSKAQKLLENWLEKMNQKFSPFIIDSELNQYRQVKQDWLSTSDEMRFVILSCLQAKEATSSAFDARVEQLERFDPSGFVKGWAIEEGLKHYLTPLLSEERIEAVNLIGGGDMQMLTKKESDWTFGVAVLDPQDKTKSAMQFEIKTGAIATSGISERGHHIWQADESILQTTVIGEHLQEVDVWATALMVNPNLKLPSHLQGYTIRK